MSIKATALNGDAASHCKHNSSPRPGAKPIGPVEQTRRNYWMPMGDVLVHNGKGRFFVILGYGLRNVFLREVRRKPWGSPGSGYIIPDPTGFIPGEPVWYCPSLERKGLTVWRGGRTKVQSRKEVAA